ncbi:MAG TPA: heavy-metal-associated domain-containing protein [Gemmatimonadaceae bacterium]|jgi:copper chaperone
MEQLRLEIDGMSCGGCVAAVRAALSRVPGVRVDDVSIGTATIAIDPSQASVGSVIDAVQDAGYDAREAA